MLEQRVFKGATRPPLVMGVPLLPMVLLFAFTLIPLGWSTIFGFHSAAIVFLCIFLAGFIWMRGLTKRDPWRTKQEIMRLILRARSGNVNLWGGVSYSPLRLKKRSK